MKKTLLRTGMAVVVAASAALGLAACGGSNSGSTSSDQSGSASASASTNSTDESEAFVADMQTAVDAVNEQISKSPDMTQIMIASDVDQPTQKYGMWVLPYKPSDAVKSFIQTIEIKNGTDFVVTAVSAESGKTWTMDQAGKMAEKTE